MDIGSGSGRIRRHRSDAGSRIADAARPADERNPERQSLLSGEHKVSAAFDRAFDGYGFRASRLEIEQCCRGTAENVGSIFVAERCGSENMVYRL